MTVNKLKPVTRKSGLFDLAARLVRGMISMFTFIMLLMLYIAAKGLRRLAGWKFFPKFLNNLLRQPLSQAYKAGTKALDLREKRSLSRVNLIELSVRNMKAKKTRTVITIGGMAIGIGTIVFLVSVGYGLQELVVSRVARLEEMRQADVSPQAGGTVRITDKTLNDFNGIPNVEMSLPLIAVVGRVSYQNSISDMAVFGVTSEYLKQSAIRPVMGTIFDSNQVSVEISSLSMGQVAGVSTYKDVVAMGESMGEVEFTINQDAWIRVRSGPSTDEVIIGYTRRSEGILQGEQVWGGSYIDDDGAGEAGELESGEAAGKWIKAKVFLWTKEECSVEEESDCIGGRYKALRDEDGTLVQKLGYFAQIGVNVNRVEVKEEANVLGITTEDVLGDSTLEWVEIASESGKAEQESTKTIEMSNEALRQAVVNRAMLNVLGIKETEALGKTFKASFVVTGDLLEEEDEKIESAETEYTIVGVTPDDKTPVFFVPFMDLRSLGITNYSQIKLVVTNSSDLEQTRRQIEAMGYVTRSVADTVMQINALFGTARTLLAVLGMVALAVAALGMFNTLTVSLLERTREVGLMKAMGMKSSEVSELLLTESMIMSFMGGILGIILGFVLGKLTGLILSAFAVFKGVGLVDVSYVPLPLIITVVFLSLLVGIATGIYPAKRATKISALNALRYE